MISWRNIPPALGRLTWDDYIEQGVLAAIARRAARSPAAPRSTRSASASAARCSRARWRCSPRAAIEPSPARRCSPRCSTSPTRATSASTCRARCWPRASRRSLAGERMQGSELAGAFASLRANDLVWNYVVSNYLKGETPPPFDLLYWNGDSSNLPGPMYVYYLANLYLDNRLREPGALTMAGEPVDLARVTCPPTSSPRATTTSCRGDRRTGPRAPRRRADVRARRVRPHRGCRQSAGQGAAQLLDQRRRAGATPTTGSPAPRAVPAAGGRTGARGSRRHGGALVRARRGGGQRREPTALSAPGRYVLESAD